jgi:Methyltransferase domain
VVLACRGDYLSASDRCDAAARSGLRENGPVCRIDQAGFDAKVFDFCTHVVPRLRFGYGLNMKEMADRIIDHYECHAHNWDADRNRTGDPWNDKPWHNRFAAMLPAGAAVLDLGCGSGSPVAEYMAERGLDVTGADSSPTLISLYRRRLPDHEWLLEDMRLLALHPRFDGILAWDSFFHLTLDDQRRMFDVFARHAARSAVLMFNTGPAHGESRRKVSGRPFLSRQPRP